MKNVFKLEIIVIIQENIEEIYNLKYSVPNKIPINFQNWSNYYHHFIITESVEKLLKSLLV